MKCGGVIPPGKSRTWQRLMKAHLAVGFILAGSGVFHHSYNTPRCPHTSHLTSFAIAESVLFVHVGDFLLHTPTHFCVSFTKRYHKTSKAARKRRRCFPQSLKNLVIAHLSALDEHLRCFSCQGRVFTRA